MTVPLAEQFDQTAASAEDLHFMQLALTLGRRGLGLTWPNPSGAVRSSRAAQAESQPPRYPPPETVERKSNSPRSFGRVPVVAGADQRASPCRTPRPKVALRMPPPEKHRAERLAE